MDQSSRVNDVTRDYQSRMTSDRQQSETQVNRRAILASGCVTLSVLAGCLSDDDTPSTSNGGTESEETDRKDEESYLTELKTDLTDKGIDIVTIEFEVEEEIVTLSYHSTGQSDNELADEIGTISGMFFTQLDEGMAAARLESTITNDSEEPIAHWNARSEWYEEMQEGTITPDELSMQILQTVETV